MASLTHITEGCPALWVPEGSNLGEARLYLHALGSWVAKGTQSSHVALGKEREEKLMRVAPGSWPVSGLGSQGCNSFGLILEQAKCWNPSHMDSAPGPSLGWSFPYQCYILVTSVPFQLGELKTFHLSLPLYKMGMMTSKPYSAVRATESIRGSPASSR